MANSDSNTDCPGPVSRRNFLQAGAIGLGGLGAADLLRLRAEASAAGNAALDTAVLLLFLSGGLPHMEMYDMKPEARSEFRGEFLPIHTDVPGIDVCELLPRHAQVADRFSLIRSIFQEFSDHGGGHKRLMTGRVPKSPVATVNDAPAGSAITAKVRERINRSLPHNILMNDPNRTHADVFAARAAYLGPPILHSKSPAIRATQKFTVRNVNLTSEIASANFC